LIKVSKIYGKKILAPDYMYLRCGMQYVYWLGYNVMLCRRSFEHQWKSIQGKNVSWDVFAFSCWKRCVFYNGI